MALLFYSQFDDPADWGKHLREAVPGLDFRVWPDVGEPKEIVAALVWKAPEGELRRFPNLRLIINLGAGYNASLGGGVNLVAELNALAGIPVTSKLGNSILNFGVQFDFNLGLVLGF